MDIKITIEARQGVGKTRAADRIEDTLLAAGYAVERIQEGRVVSDKPGARASVTIIEIQA